MDVGDNRNAQITDLCEHFKAFFDSRTPVRVERGPVCLVKGSLEDIRYADARGDFAQGKRNLLCHIIRFKDAGTGDQGKGPARADRERFGIGNIGNFNVIHS